MSDTTEQLPLTRAMIDAADWAGLKAMAPRYGIALRNGFGRQLNKQELIETLYVVADLASQPIEPAEVNQADVEDAATAQAIVEFADAAIAAAEASEPEQDPNACFDAPPFDKARAVGQIDVAALAEFLAEPHTAKEVADKFGWKSWSAKGTSLWRHGYCVREVGKQGRAKTFMAEPAAV